MVGQLIPGNTGRHFAILLAGLAAGAVHSQTIDEVTVTTRKTTEDLQDVPIAITAVGAEEIQRLGIKDFEQVVDLDTSIRIQDSNFFGGGGSITIRGLAPIAGRPNVATLIDGIDVTSEGLSLDGGSMLIDPRLIDVERIEIVKGPQNVLFGRNAFAGAIQYVTKEPTETFYADIGVDVATDGYETLRGSISGPINDTLGYRINALWYDEDGFYRNSMTGAKIGGAEGAGAALTLKWQPSDNLSFKWRVEYSDDKFAIPAQAALPTNTDLPVDPLASACNTTPAGNPGPVADRNCLGSVSQVVSDYFDNPDTGSQVLGLGEYDPSLAPDENPFRNQFHDMVSTIFTGPVPDVSQLEALTGHKDGISISPNYQYGAGAVDPAQAVDYPGNERDVLRSTMIVEWGISDSLTMTSWTSWADANAFTAQDGDKVAIPVLLDPLDPTSLVDDTSATLNIFQNVDTELFSQEIRFAADLSDVMDVTFGGLYWNEKAEQNDRSSPIVLAGPQCYVRFDEISDVALDPASAFFFTLNPVQHECGRTSAPARDWAAEAFEANPGYFSGRETKHFSLYGSLDYQFLDRWELRAEARWSKEDTKTAGPRMTPCWEGLTRAEAATAGCLEPYDVIIGPGTLVLCGQTGRCDTAHLSSTIPGFEENDWGWWPYNFTPIAARTDTFKKSESWIAPKMTITYRPADAMMFYGSWAIAEKPGGFSLLTSGTFGVDPNLDGVPDEIGFEPEEMTVWELGGKTEWQDRRLLVNGALFFEDFSDKQVRISEVIGGSTGPVIRNAAGAEIWGLEMDASWAATERLTLAGAFTWLDTEYTDYTTKANNAREISALGCEGLTDFNDKKTGLPVLEEGGACIVSRTGHELERSPELAASIMINYTAPFMETGTEWYVQWRTLYEDEQFANAENNVILQSRSITDLRFGLQADQWDFQLYVKNLFDDDTIPSAGQTGPDLPNSEFRIGLKALIPPLVLGNPQIPRLTFANLPPPRQVGVQLGYRFGN
jgi:iron complex outermembrane receptor protein